MEFFIKTVESVDHWGDKKIIRKIQIHRIIACLAIILAILIIVSSVFTIIPTGHTGVITIFGKTANYTFDEGFHFKAPWHRVIKMDNRIQKATSELSCFSSDLQEVNTRLSINFQLDASQAMNVYRTVGKKYSDTLIAPVVLETAKEVIAQYTAEQLIANRAHLAEAFESTLAMRLAERDIIVTSTSIEDMDFTDAFTNAVEEKQVAQQNKLKAETQAAQKVIEAEAAANMRKIDADAAAYEIIAQAEAQAEANEKLANSITNEILSKMYYEKWNGILPQVMNGESGSSVIVNIPKE